MISMKTRTTKIAGWGLIALTVFCLGFAGGAYADKGGKGKDHGKGHENSQGHNSQGDDDDVTIHWHDRDSHDDKIVIEIGAGDRSAIMKYLNDDYRKFCPPGLAKKRNGCLPPGQAKKYVIGQRLPGDIVFVPVPDDLLLRLRPVPAGYQYVQVDKDILLIGEASKKVIDAVTLLSAVGE